MPWGASASVCMHVNPAVVQFYPRTGLVRCQHTTKSDSNSTMHMCTLPPSPHRSPPPPKKASSSSIPHILPNFPFNVLEHHRVGETYHSDLIMGSLAPSRQLLAVDCTQKDRQRLVRLTVAVWVHLQLPFISTHLEHITATEHAYNNTYQAQVES